MLTIEHLEISFKKRDILRDVSLCFEPGLHYIIGPNGSGKTSLLRAVMNMIPFKGKIRIDSIDLSTLSPLARAQRIAWLPQHPSWPAHLNVRDYVLLGRFPYLSWLGNYSKTDFARVERILVELKIEEMANQPIGTLSGGERQQVALARALAQDTSMLLLDEPAQALDPLNKALLYDRLVEIAKNKTVVCTTHDLDYLTIPGATILALSRDGSILWQKPSGIEKKQLMKEVFSSLPLE